MALITLIVVEVKMAIEKLRMPTGAVLVTVNIENSSGISRVQTLKIIMNLLEQILLI